uniref:Uncharacterized protein n=1 Tax=Anopheles maculatus TaxID=74869 RepID=A0A182T8E4_9DIPT
MQVNPNTTIETNAVLTKPPIMSTVEVPTKNGIEQATTSRASEKRFAAATVSSRMATGSSTVAAAAAAASGSTSGPSLPCAIASGQTSTNLDETLAAVIGHVPSNPHVPTSLELPITVTNPVIAKTSTASSRMNAAALFPLTTTATAVSSLAGGDTISAVVLVSGGADAPGTIDRVPPSTSPPLVFPPVQRKGGRETGEGEALRGEVVVEDEGKPCPLSGEPTIADEPCIEDAEDDIQIPNTPESQQADEQRQQQRHDDEFSDDNVDRHDGPNHTHNHLLVEDEDETNSNCSEIIAIQPNVVVLDAELLLNSPPNDDGIDDEMDNDSEEEAERNELLEVREQPSHHQQLQQLYRSRHVAAARSANGGEGDGRPNTVNLAEHHNSSNNDSGIDTSMAGGGGGVSGGGGNGARCEATAPSGAPAVRSSTIVER